MADTLADDTPGLVAEEPEHGHDCYRLICTGQAYYMEVNCGPTIPQR
jgi:hypothetical protein